MRRKFLTAMIVAGAFSLGACTEDATMDELIQDIELNENTDPPGEGDPDDPGSSGGNN